jgi:hypothetical protein
MQSLEFALDHAPIVPLSDQLDHYTSVDFANIDDKKFYYFIYGPYDEFIVEIDDKSETLLLLSAFAHRSRQPLGAWIPIYEPPVFDVTPDMMQLGYKFYNYTELKLI